MPGAGPKPPQGGDTSSAGGQGIRPENRARLSRSPVHRLTEEDVEDEGKTSAGSVDHRTDGPPDAGVTRCAGGKLRDAFLACCTTSCSQRFTGSHPRPAAWRSAFVRRLPRPGPRIEGSASAKAINSRHEGWKARLPKDEKDLWNTLTAFDGPPKRPCSPIAHHLRSAVQSRPIAIIRAAYPPTASYQA